MAGTLVIAHHLIWTAYGWWLPNDPRGSMSRHIRSDIIADLGDVHYGRKQVQPASDIIKTFYENAGSWLRHELLTFDARAMRVIADAFAAAIAREKYTCYACAIMPDHVHILIRKHKHTAEQMIQNFQHASSQHLYKVDLRTADHPVWGGPGWKVFLHHPDDVRRTIRYVNNNPRKGRLPDQHWPFVTPYNNWPLHPGHSPNSPYARQLRRAGRYP